MVTLDFTISATFSKKIGTLTPSTGLRNLRPNLNRSLGSCTELQGLSLTIIGVHLSARRPGPEDQMGKAPTCETAHGSEMAKQRQKTE